MKKLIKAGLLGLSFSVLFGVSQNQAEAASVQLPSDAQTWHVYKVGHPLLKANSANVAGLLAPSRFGGLTYEILGTVGPNSYIINTEKFGKVEIYAGPETGAKVIGDTPTTSTSTTSSTQTSSSTGLKLHLPATAHSWTVYKMGHPLLKANPKNVAGVLSPSKFGGLTYDVVGKVDSNSYVINTENFGQVEIYAGPNTDAQLTGDDSSVPTINTPTPTQTYVNPIAAPSVPTSTSASTPSTFNGQAIVNYAKQYLGMPYVWGGSNPSTSFDCSGFIYWVYKNNGYNIYRSNVAGYWSMTDRIQHVSTPQVGDLVFFQNTYTSGPSHIGIYIGNGQFIGANDNGISIASLANPYYASHFLGYGHFKY